MRIYDLLEMCLRNLFRRKVRTILSVMGVVIGTCAIIITISLGVGSEVAQTEAIAKMQDLTIIEVYNYGFGGSSDNAPPKLDDSIVNFIKSIDYVVATTPIQDVAFDKASIFAGNYKYDGSITGVYIDELVNFGYVIKEGRHATSHDPKTTIIFGENAPYYFYNTKRPNDERVWPYPDENGIVQPPTINVMQKKLSLNVREMATDEYGNPLFDWSEATDTSNLKEKVYDLNVVGILKGGKDYYTFDSVFVDLEFLDEIEKQYNKLNGIKESKNDTEQDLGYNHLLVKVDDMDNVAFVDKKIQELGYETYSFEQIRKPMQEQARTNQLIFGSLGAISLLVAAFGIANTMIMSVYERSKEIGVMKVLGCPTGNIKLLFLMEAGFIGLIGGIVGVVLSYLVSYIMNNLSVLGNIGSIFGGEMIATSSSTISIIPPWLLALGLIFSLLVGLISGVIPAQKAVSVSALTAIKQDN